MIPCIKIPPYLYPEKTFVYSFTSFTGKSKPPERNRLCFRHNFANSCQACQKTHSHSRTLAKELFRFFANKKNPTVQWGKVSSNDIKDHSKFIYYLVPLSIKGVVAKPELEHYFFIGIRNLREILFLHKFPLFRFQYFQTGLNFPDPLHIPSDLLFNK